MPKTLITYWSKSGQKNPLH